LSHLRPWRDIGSIRDAQHRIVEHYQARRAQLLTHQEAAAERVRDGLKRRPGFERLTADEVHQVLRHVSAALTSTSVDAVAPPLSELRLAFDERLRRAADEASALLDDLLAAKDERLAAAGVRLTDDPALRSICGISSGGICAFTVAFERPDLFRRVLSHVGSFTDIRGGDHYPSLVRQTKESPKPIRVFLQAGEHDLDNRHGHWWLSNLSMEKALAFSGYDHKLVGGIGGHNGKHGGAILPESLQWLMRGWDGAE
jgi:hypothetical protein